MPDKRMTAAQLIAALQKMDPDETIQVKIVQHNKHVGYFVPLITTKDQHGYEYWINSRGIITIHLPTPAVISKWPK